MSAHPGTAVRGPVVSGSKGWLRRVCALLLMQMLLMAGAAWGANWAVTEVEVAPGDFGSSPARQSGEGWRPTTLPEPWLKLGRSGTWTYRFPLEVCPSVAAAKCVQPGQVEGLWVPKVGRELTVWVNGARVLHLGPVGAVERDLTRRPVMVTIPAPLLRSGANEFRLVVTAPEHQVAGLSRVWLGSTHELTLRHASRDHLVMGMPGAVATMSAILTALGVLTALRFGGTAVWLFSLIGVLWTARELLLLVGFFVLPLNTVLAMAPLLQAAAVLMSCWLLLDLMALSERRWVRVLKWLVACTPLVALAWCFGGEASWVWIWAWRRLTDAAGLCMTAVAAYALWRQPSWSRLFVAVGMIGSASLAFIDVWLLELSERRLGFEHVPVTSLMAVFFLLSVSASIYMRVAQALRVEQRHKQVLAQEVSRQRRELERLHARESERLRAEAVVNERARIVREMHDGLGSQLVGLLSTVESGEYTQAELTSEVHEAMGQLRLTIDTLEPLGDDLSSLLGQLRFRLDGRLRKAGLKLVWQVRALPVADHLSAADLSHLQRLLYEVFANVIKHAQATQVQVCAVHDEARRCIDIRVVDNGCGFDAGQSPSGRGLNNMRYRAEQIGAVLRTQSAPGEGTEVILQLPVMPAQG